MSWYIEMTSAANRISWWKINQRDKASSSRIRRSSSFLEIATRSAHRSDCMTRAITPSFSTLAISRPWSAIRIGWVSAMLFLVSMVRRPLMLTSRARRATLSQWIRQHLAPAFGAHTILSGQAAAAIHFSLLTNGASCFLPRLLTNEQPQRGNRGAFKSAPGRRSPLLRIEFTNYLGKRPEAIRPSSRQTHE